ncbi:hypothetical protein BD410DRAFT_186986 [Rickenella mellea]|uniref:Uncharacterized protein n=1 Tax=Rickenella mellea TaxID=50990 RepID=A0A4Y7Q635_9AGAM|nr:hypothetical protein BD410DRAFT_186986 [Rickenella mellea]
MHEARLLPSLRKHHYIVNLNISLNTPSLSGLTTGGKITLPKWSRLREWEYKLLSYLRRRQLKLGWTKMKYSSARMITPPIRFISDNVRLEEIADEGPHLNASAGQNLLRYLRGRLLSAPVLIYTGASITWTRYVMRYESAGSTTSPAICMEYIASLAAGMSDDTKWKGFKVIH